MAAIKNTAEIIKKLGISSLNDMQNEALEKIQKGTDTVLLSPTGSGKTMAFLLPLINLLDTDLDEIQAIILVPSRELAIQIEQVFREMGTGYKANAIYGGRAFGRDLDDLSHPPAILIGTPGRIADHVRRETIKLKFTETLVLDEFDKSLEVGFEPEMIEIIEAITSLKTNILTSATEKVKIPKFVNLDNPKRINYNGEIASKLTIRMVRSDDDDKLELLLNTLYHCGNEPGIIFCNLKESIAEISDFLKRNRIQHGLYHGDLEQKDRERALIKFRNGTHKIILATDLAARGLDIPELKFIIHFQLPNKVEELIHRNGRTARMQKAGSAYILNVKGERNPDYTSDLEYKVIKAKDLKIEDFNSQSDFKTLFISGGRKDKISKGDIAGLLFKKGDLTKDDFGLIELKQDCAFISVKATEIQGVIKKLNNTFIKKRKVRMYEV